MAGFVPNLELARLKHESQLLLSSMRQMTLENRDLTLQTREVVQETRDILMAWRFD